MSFCRISAFVVVDDKISAEVTEAFLTCIDSLVRNNIRVFESDAISTPVDDVPEADELRKEMPNGS